MALRVRKTRPAIVGVDLDPAGIAVAEVDKDDPTRVTRGAVASLPPGVVRDGEVVDAAALTEALRELWADADRPRRVRLGIAGQRIVVRTLMLPPVAHEREIADAVEAEIAHNIPIPVEDAIVDHVSLGEVQTESGPRLRVVVVAARKDMIERHTAAVRAAGLEIEGIDLSAFGLVRALRNPIDGDDAMLYVSHAGLTNVAVTIGDGCVFSRATAGGFDSMVLQLAEARHLTDEHAAQWLEHVGLSRPLVDVEGDPDVVAAARSVLQQGVSELATAISNTLNFYRMQPQVAAVQRCVVSGRATDIDGFVDDLRSRLDLPVEARSVSVADGVVAAPARLAVAAGLAAAA